MLESLDFEKPQEISTEGYLRNLPKSERHSLVDLLTLIFSDKLVRHSPIMALAVGTTTYPLEYWEGLKKYLIKSGDLSKLPIVERRGEDIDVQLCGDSIHAIYPEMTQEWIDIIRNVFDSEGLDYTFNGEKGPSRVKYLTISEEYKKRYNGKSVLRLKDVDYGPNFRVTFEKTRPIHIIFNNDFCGDWKIKVERQQNNPFSILFRRGEYWDLEKTLKSMEKQGELF